MRAEYAVRKADTRPIEIAEEAKGAPWKRELAIRLRKEVGAGHAWITEKLNLTPLAVGLTLRAPLPARGRQIHGGLVGWGLGQQRCAREVRRVRGGGVGAGKERCGGAAGEEFVAIVSLKRNS